MIARTYQDLLDEIQFYNTRIRQLNYERAALLLKHGAPAGLRGARLDPSGVKSSVGFLSVEEVFLRVQQIEASIRDCKQMKNLLLKQLDEINKSLYRLEGRPYKIFWLHKCENKNFKDIAEEVGLSLSQVQRIYKDVLNEEVEAAGN
ncbi:transposase family protein [Anoxybacterium hadale]|uniref:Transposase family protein n=1 Tax=Anoxybacterium hadale TaxID=3408580 RepID=A0ACD1ABV8_9FIRM|nr:transposase family protein [Clostridiales bacterium]